MAALLSSAIVAATSRGRAVRIRLRDTFLLCHGGDIYKGQGVFLSFFL